MKKMLLECIENLKNERDVRKNLILLKGFLKDETAIRIVNQIDTEEFNLEFFLENEDPKVRKNAALIMGQLQKPEYFEGLFLAYLNEEQLFIRSSLLKSLAGYNLNSKLEILEKRMVLLKDLIHSENTKHYLEEQKVLRKILRQYKNINKHTFIGLDKEYTMVLTTLRNHQDIVGDALASLLPKKVALGVQIRAKSLKEIMNYHCFSDILFPIVKIPSFDIEDLSEKIVNSPLHNFLMRVHEGDDGLCFRLAIHSLEEVDVKKLGHLIERKSDAKLINSPSNYEVEIYIRESKNREALVYVRLMCIHDIRFKYREQYLATSINPVVAGTLMQYIVPYITDDAKVLDPFCGVGTMLIERNHIEKTHFLMGIDYYGEAIKKAKKNTEKSGLPIHYVQRDIFSFSHTHEFDEIITNMPSYSSRIPKRELEKTYSDFFYKMDSLLVEKGYAFLHTYEIGLIKKNLRKYNSLYSLIDEVKILSGKNNSYLFIIQKN